MNLHELAREVRMRANGRCQYCLMHESLQGATFHIEHVYPKSKGGQSDLNNVVLACPGCNLQKGSRTDAIDPVSGNDTDHFYIVERRIEGLTAVGRATVEALDLNRARRQRIREVEEAFGLFPP